MTLKFATVAAAIIGSVSVAQAADLGKPAPAAVDYVKVCDAYGAGFFYIPGGETCLKIDGYVRADFRTGDSDAIAPGSYVGPYVWDDNQPTKNSWFTRARALVHFDARTNTEFGLLRSYIEVYWTTNTGNGGAVQTDLDLAFVQWGGLTAGRAQSVYDFFTGYAYGMVFGDMASDTKTNLIAYTLSAGNGISATIALEDATTNGTRRRGIFDIGYGGNKAPDVVGNIMIAQAWGTAKLSGALHHIQPSIAAVDEEWGYAVQGAVEINLPGIGSGTKLAGQIAYAEGAISYASGNFISPGFGIGTDAVVSGTSLKKTSAWSSMAGVQTKLTPVVQVDLNAGYGSVDGFKARDFDQLEIASDIRYTAAPGLVIGVGLEYRDISFSSATKRATGLKDASAWVSGLRVQRNF